MLTAMRFGWRFSRNSYRYSSNSFQHANRGSFFQRQPMFDNPYTTDKYLQNYLRRNLPPKHFEDLNEKLTKFGDKISKEVHFRSLECETNPPTLKQFDAWGNRVDEVITCSSWKYMKKLSAEEGVIGLGYKRDYGEFSRLFQFSKMYLFAPSSGLFSCPLAMVDGAASILENLPTQTVFTKTTLKRLTTTDPEEFWTCGQWMTERRGGSDVANGTETLAYLQEDNSYKLYGYKWFTSATDADVALTLGRIVSPGKEPIKGSRGLSLFILPIRNKESHLASKLNGLEVQRFKDKLGTRQLPTSEMLLDGTTSYLIGEEGNGVKNISAMLTLTRIHNSLASVGYMRKILQLAVDYSKKREAFGSLICELPLHVKTLADMDIRSRASFVLTFEVISLLGKIETDKSSKNEELLLRFLTPLVKLHTAKEAVKIASEGLECFGGQGYLEDTGLPGMLRDAQVLSIWEGTTNVLSLDVLRAIKKSNGEVLDAYFEAIIANIDAVKRSKDFPILESSVKRVENAVNNIKNFIDENFQNNSSIEFHARELAYSFARTYAAGLLLKNAVNMDSDQGDIIAAIKWSQTILSPVQNNTEIQKECEDLKRLVYV